MATIKRTEELSAPSSSIGRFRVIRHLASGGMAEVFLAQAGNEPPVAVKRLKPHLAGQPGVLEMFFEEAFLGTQLRHPNLVRVIEVDQDPGGLLIVMEFLHGETANSMIRTALKQNRRVPPGVALHVVLCVSAGLSYAHDRTGEDGAPLSVVHRDVSPQNIICTYDGRVKLLDFGIAKSSQRATQTQGGMLKGKVSYMSPEHCLGIPVDRRADVFSLGIVLYELTLCRKLYHGRTDFDVMRAIVDGEVTPPSRIDRSYDPGLEAVVMRALEKSRTRRFQTAREFGDALGDVIHRLGVRLGATDMQNFFSEFFADRVEAWRVARLQGRSLAEHLAAAMATRDEDKDADTGSAIADSLRAVRTGLEIPAARSGSKRSSRQADDAGDEWHSETTGEVPRLQRATTLRPNEVTAPSLRVAAAAMAVTVTAPAVAQRAPAAAPGPPPLPRRQRSGLWFLLALQLPTALAAYDIGRRWRTPPAQTIDPTGNQTQTPASVSLPLPVAPPFYPPRADSAPPISVKPAVVPPAATHSSHHSSHHGSHHSKRGSSRHTHE